MVKNTDEELKKISWLWFSDNRMLHQKMILATKFITLSYIYHDRENKLPTIILSLASLPLSTISLSP
jgi:hypothetical protein